MANEDRWGVIAHVAAEANQADAVALETDIEMLRVIHNEISAKVAEATETRDIAAILKLAGELHATGRRVGEILMHDETSEPFRTSPSSFHQVVRYVEENIAPSERNHMPAEAETADETPQSRAAEKYRQILGVVGAREIERRNALDSSFTGAEQAKYEGAAIKSAASLSRISRDLDYMISHGQLPFAPTKGAFPEPMQFS